MIVVDASVLIAFLDPNDAHLSAAVETLEDAPPPLDKLQVARLLRPRRCRHAQHCGRHLRRTARLVRRW
jgi:hypothetical protein